MKLTNGALPLAAALLASSAEALIGGGPPPKPNVKPHIVDGFAWRDPFALEAMATLEPACEVTKKFQVSEFTLNDLLVKAPQGLKPWASGLKKLFSEREYPGGWAGIDVHGLEREILSMEYTDVPLELRKWIEEQERTEGAGKGLFGVFDKPQTANDTITEPVTIPSADSVDRSLDEGRVAIFAPGAIYHVLPLWAAEDSNCKGKP